MVRALFLAAALLVPLPGEAQGPGQYGSPLPAASDPFPDPGPRADSRDREAWLEDRILRAMTAGVMDRRRGRLALRDLETIRRFDAIYRGGDGTLTPDQNRDLQSRLDDLRASLFMR